MTYYDKAMAERHTRGRHQYGEKYDGSELDSAHASIKDAFAARLRVKVRDAATGYERFGIISTTTGWRPGFLLMHRSSDIGSSDLIRPTDYVIAVRRDHGRYRPGTPYGMAYSAPKVEVSTDG